MAGRCANAWPIEADRLPQLAVDWLGPRAWFSSAPLPAGRRVALVSSRLPRSLDPCDPWLEALRAALARLHADRSVALVAAGAAGADFVRRGAERQRGPRIVIRPDPPRVAVPELEVHLWMEPPVELRQLPLEVADSPERDRALIAWADEILVLGLRWGGNMHQLLRCRLSAQPSHVLLANWDGLQSRRAREQLVRLGAAVWPAVALPRRKGAEPGAVDSAIEAGIVLPRAGSTWDYLTHCTRACPGPWPGQSNQDYWDSLLDGGSNADHSPWGTLQRIVAQRKLYASARAIRGGHAVVSFTAVPLADLPLLRVFRSHRARWDFEPYGICIRRERLAACGAKPVRYGDESVWEGMPACDRPFFQYRRDISISLGPSAAAASIDWSVEREWRHVGDLDLNSIPAGDVLLFVPTRAEARKLLEFSPWPVTVVARRGLRPAE